MRLREASSQREQLAHRPRRKRTLLLPETKGKRVQEEADRWAGPVRPSKNFCLCPRSTKRSAKMTYCSGKIGVKVARGKAERPFGLQS